MRDDPLDRRLESAIALIREAGAMAAGFAGRLGTLAITLKGPQDVASEADLAVEALIRGRLARDWPDDAFLGEESGATAMRPGQGVWVVDPIDGTQPFVSGLATWCVSIAYVVGREVEIGLVFDPSAGELFAARRGGPATLNGAPIRPHPATSLTQGITSVGYSSRVGPDAVLPVLERLLRRGGMFHRNGSGALSLCHVACGRLLGYVEAHINSWDCLGAVAVIRAAGGRTSDFLAGDGLMHGNPLVAGAPGVFAELEAVLGG